MNIGTLRISCACGNEIPIRKSQAGELVPCECGQTLLVPKLSVLRDHWDRTEAIPAETVPAEMIASQESATELPEEFVIHFTGEVSSTGHICPSAMASYAAVLQRKINAALDRLEPTGDGHVLVSCALLPNGDATVEVDRASLGDTDWARSLHAELVAAPRPRVQDQPVALGFFRRFGSLPAGGIELAPFRQLLADIDAPTVGAALMEAAGLRQSDAESQASAQPRRSWWQRIRDFFSRSSRPEPRREYSREATYAKLVTWYQEVISSAGDLSIEAFERYRRQDPDDAAIHVILADKYLDREDWTACLDSYSNAIRLMPNFALLYGLRGKVHQLQSNCQDALADYDQAIAMAPFDAWLYYQRSQIYVELEAWPQALEDLAQSHQLAPHDTEFLQALAGVSYETGQPEAAREHLEQVLELDPNSGRAHRLLGWICQDCDAPESNRAIDHFTSAIELLPDTMDLYLYRSWAYAAQNKFALALDDCESVLVVDPESAAAHGIRGRILHSQGDFEDAVEACTRAIEFGDESSMVMLIRGMSYLATDQPELASSDCETVLAAQPNNPLALQLRGNLALQSSELDDAMEAYRRASELSPQWAEPRTHLALLHRIQEDPQAAIEEQSFLIEQEPSNPSHFVNRALAYSESNSFDAAEADFDKALEMDPENDEILFLRGNLFMRCQDFERALSDYNQALQIEPDHDNARLQRATVLLHLKRQDEALEDYSRLIAKHPDDPRAYMGRAYTFSRLGDDAAAEADQQRLMDIAPEDSESITAASQVAKVNRLRAEDEYEQALEVAEEMIQSAPDDGLGYRLRAGVHWDLEQLVEAVEDYSRALELGEPTYELLSARGQVLAEQGEWRPALDDLDQAIDWSRSEGARLVLAHSLSGRGLALAGLGRIDEATRDFDESAALCPDNPWVYFHRGMVLYARKEYEEAAEMLSRAAQVNSPPLPLRKRQRASAVQEKAREHCQ